MNTQKKNKIALAISIVILAVSILLIGMLPKYNYSKVDLTRDQNKIMNVEYPMFYCDVSEFEGFGCEFFLNVYNTTESDLDNVVFTIYAKDIDDKECVFVSEPISLLSRVESERYFEAKHESPLVRITKFQAQIGDGEKFDVELLSTTLPNNPFIVIMSFAFFIGLFGVIVASVRINKLAKKKADIDAEAYAKRADEFVDLELRKEKIMVDQMEREMNETQKTPPPAKVKCSYCGCDNEATENKCRVCGARLHK